MAREVAAIAGKPLRDPVKMDLLPKPGSPVQVEIEDLALCPRYSALVFENVRVMPSPLWLQFRLIAVGLNPINNIVDLTNYIMAELAQPMHAFDRAKLAGDTIYARPARAGERITALNDEAYELTPSTVVIADAAGPIAIAGVIGERDLRGDDVDRSRECEFSGGFRPEDVVGTKAAHGCFDAFREGAGSAQYGARAGTGAGTFAVDLAGHSTGGRVSGPDAGNH